MKFDLKQYQSRVVALITQGHRPFEAFRLAQQKTSHQPASQLSLAPQRERNAK